MRFRIGSRDTFYTGLLSDRVCVSMSRVAGLMSYEIVDENRTGDNCPGYLKVPSSVFVTDFRLFKI